MRADVQLACDAWEAGLPDAERLVVEAAAVVGGDREAAVLLADDETVRGLNWRFRHKDEATNVLAFPAPSNLDGFAGDIVLAHGVVTGEAAAQGKPAADHLRHLVIHGLLHLNGYDHIQDADAETMEALERELLSQLGIPDPYADGHAPVPADR
ncbi:MAG TPA: rRNA maturation RNase YbeY [Caulobacteraceae bacterium]|jgi:probable rRNA maturation factor|nr:rRNA maturation RNase YbeY [Caulobacteraceae bacterium]